MFPTPFRPFAVGRRRGFSLVELLIVIGIIMVLVAVSAPLLTSMAQRRSLEGSVELAKVEFMQLRERAATTGVPIVTIMEHWTDPIRLVSWMPLHDEDNDRWIWAAISVMRLPDRVWAPDDWLEEVTDMTETGVPTGLPVRDAIMTLLVATAPQQGHEYYQFHEKTNTPDNIDGMMIRRDRKKCYALIFMPDGTVQVVGRPNVPITELQVPDSEKPNGDIILTNGRDILYMCINPATARIEWVKRSAN